MSTQETKCWSCKSDKEPYFSRTEPMGNYCQDCGKNYDEPDTPLTDGFEDKYWSDEDTGIDYVFNFARRLERERDEARRLAENWRKESNWIGNEPNYKFPWEGAK